VAGDDPNNALKEGAAKLTHGDAWNRLRGMLVISEVGGSPWSADRAGLLVAASCAWSYRPGFNPHNVLRPDGVGGRQGPIRGRARREALYREIVEQVGRCRACNQPV